MRQSSGRPPHEPGARGRVARRLQQLAGLAALLLPAGASPNEPAELLVRAKASLAEIEGRVALHGLGAPVEVVRDRWGIPHIRAQNLDDLFFAQGFVQAQDRLFQMELWRRTTQGRLAEILGPEYVERDRITRLTTRYRGDLAAEWRSYDETAQQAATRFVAGINCFVDQLRGRPLEFDLAGFAAEHWAPEDLLARAEAFGMSSNATSEVTRARLIQAVGPALAARLKPTAPQVSLLPPPGLELAAVDRALAEALGRIGSGARFAPPAAQPAGPYPDDGDGDGSNNWVVHGSRTATGRPILANDPHRALDHPSLRYLVHLEAPGFQVVGAVVPWFPGVAIGHNDRVAWGLTIFNIDAQDLFVEELDPADPDRYRVGDGFVPMRVERETIQVKGAAPVEVKLKFTRHGPVVREDLARRLAYALCWTGSEPGTAGYLAGLALDKARNWSEFRAALRRWKMPGENFVYADVDGNIGYQAAGLAPIRKQGNGLLPVPGARGEYDWVGFRTLEDLPSDENPQQGFLATANNNTLRPGDAVVGYEWASRFRIDRIREILGRSGPFDLAAAQALQQDVTALPARALVPLLAGLRLDEPRPRAARELLLGWDRLMTRQSSAAALFAAWQLRLTAAYVQSLLQGGQRLAPELLGSAGAQVLIDGLATAGIAERDALLRGSLDAAVADLAGRLGPDLHRWRWGDLHTVSFVHKLGVDASTRALFDPGPLGRPGYAYTVNMTGGAGYAQNDGASFREVLDLADWDRSVATSVPGQSGQPGSPHFSDLVPDWAAGRYFPLAFSRAKVEQVAAHRLILEPSR